MKIRWLNNARTMAALYRRIWYKPWSVEMTIVRGTPGGSWLFDQSGTGVGDDIQKKINMVFWCEDYDRRRADDRRLVEDIRRQWKPMKPGDKLPELPTAKLLK